MAPEQQCRPCHGEDDLACILDLFERCARAGYVDMELWPMGLRTLLRDPVFDPQRTLLCGDESGQLSGFAILWGGQYLGMLVHPDMRGVLEPELLAWAVDYMRHSAPAGSGPGRLYVLCRSDDAHARQLLEEAGYTLDMTEWRMGRFLNKPLPDAILPQGFTLRSLRGERDLEEWLALYAKSFPANTAHLQRWRRMRADPDWLPALDLIAVTADGLLAGACTCTIASAQAPHMPVWEGRTEPVMVRAEFQGHGLGSTLVLSGLRALREHGADVAMLTTESDNHGAHRMYFRLGYLHLYDACWYGRDV